MGLKRAPRLLAIRALQDNIEVSIPFSLVLLSIEAPDEQVRQGCGSDCKPSRA